MKLALVAVPLFLAVGCAVSQDHYADDFARVDCHREQECDKGSFENNYDSMSDCEDQQSKTDQQILGAFLAFGCDYDSQMAYKCLASHRSASCEDFSKGNFDPACNDICG